LGLLPIVVAIAAAWHLGLTLLERYRTQKLNRTPLAKLLLMAEAEVLHTLKSELIRKLSKIPRKTLRLRLEEVERRLKEIENRDSR
jgi:hypothetical protein